MDSQIFDDCCLLAVEESYYKAKIAWFLLEDMTLACGMGRAIFSPGVLTNRNGSKMNQ
jgi:hypothetical protein